MPRRNNQFSTFMGEWERKAEAKAHEQRTDVVADEKAATSGAQGQLVVVTCIKTVGDAVVPYGASVRLLDRKRDRVEVFLAGRCVGEVCNDDTRTLRERFGIATRTGSSFGGQCVSETDTPHFSVEVTV